MAGHVKTGCGSAEQLTHDDGTDMIRRGPWTAEEDSMLNTYVTIHGEGRWNSVARCAGLKRTGKSCRLRWLNYLRPDVRRGNISLKEQLLILELHSRWGNRWSKIAQFLPGRTDNEIKNYWRTRVQKQAKQLKCDVNSKQFRDAMRYVWIPRMMERIRAASDPYSDQPAAAYSADHCPNNRTAGVTPSQAHAFGTDPVDPYLTPAISVTSSDSSEAQAVSDLTECCDLSGGNYPDNPQKQNRSVSCQPGLDIQAFEHSNIGWFDGGDSSWDGLWSDENMWFLQQQLCDVV